MYGGLALVIGGFSVCSRRLSLRGFVAGSAALLAGLTLLTGMVFRQGSGRPAWTTAMLSLLLILPVGLGLTVGRLLRQRPAWWLGMLSGGAYLAGLAAGTIAVLAWGLVR